MSEAAGRGAILIAIARAAIVRAAVNPDEAAWALAWLREPGASFVTLRLAGELRGCIGSVEPRRALGDDVAHNAIAAAYRDPRFPPATAAEVECLQVEVSLLSRREPLAARSEAEAVALLRPGVDGVCFEFQDRAATFLPQVWENLPRPVDFLGELRRKAGLEARFWHPDVRLSRYTVEKFA